MFIGLSSSDPIDSCNICLCGVSSKKLQDKKDFRLISALDMLTYSELLI